MTTSTQAKPVVERSSDRWTIRDLEYFPVEEGKRYEIVEGELLVTTQPHWRHQQTCGRIFAVLDNWAREHDNGEASQAPGLLFDDENAVAPDVVWVSGDRLSVVLGEDGKLHESPDLAVEVLSPGTKNERRDRESKLRLYSQRGVREYWIVEWRTKRLEVYRREQAALKLVATLLAEDELTSPLLPAFKVPMARLFPK
ncbi:MAG: Uma2 family endonuclease [Chloroflexota bacterium]